MFEILIFVTRRGFISQNDSIIYSDKCRLALHYKYTFLINIPKIEEHRNRMFIVFKFHQLKFLLSPLCVLFSDNWIPSWSVVSSITSAMDV